MTEPHLYPNYKPIKSINPIRHTPSATLVSIYRTPNRHTKTRTSTLIAERRSLTQKIAEFYAQARSHRYTNQKRTRTCASLNHTRTLHESPGRACFIVCEQDTHCSTTTTTNNITHTKYRTSSEQRRRRSANRAR